MPELKTLDFIIEKKNRLYFAATQKGYKCKIKITPESESLELGAHTLLVNDLSVKSKYGTDLVYSVAADIKGSGICTLKHFTFNDDLVTQCHALGGKWDADEKAWVFSAIVEDAVDELDFTFNNEIIPIEITALGEVWGSRGPARFSGYSIAIAFGRDSGARLGDGISKISGEISSGGSVKNWGTSIKEGAVFRLMCPKALAVSDDSWEVKIL